MKHFLLLNLLITTILLWSCRDDYNICNQPRDVKFVGGFYKKIGSSEVGVSLSNLTIFQLNTNTNIYNNQANISLFSLPLNPVLDTSKFVIRIENALQADTVSIIYTSKQVLLSAECGNVTNYSLSKILFTTNTIDSIKIINSEVTTGLNQNTKIYF
jgi:Family of unknown function (DUF6452)